MFILAKFSDNRFLDAFRDILRDTLTATSIMTLIIIAIKRLLPTPDFIDGLFLAISLLVSLLIILWYVNIINRSILTIENTFEDSRHFNYIRYLWGVVGCFLVLFLAYTLGGTIAGVITSH